MWGIHKTILKVPVYMFGGVVLILCLTWLPQTASLSAEMYPEYAHLKYPILIGMYITAVPFFFAVYQAIRFLSTDQNRVAVKSLHYIRICAYIIIVLYLIGFVFLSSQHVLHPGIALLGMLIIVITSFIVKISTSIQKNSTCY